MSANQIFLSRRNLLTLLSKLDRAKQGESTTRTIIKSDDKHPKYPQTCKIMIVTAVEDEEYYSDRLPGQILKKDEDRLKIAPFVSDPLYKEASKT